MIDNSHIGGTGHVIAEAEEHRERRARQPKANSSSAISNGMTPLIKSCGQGHLIMLNRRLRAVAEKGNDRNGNPVARATSVL
ncbi:hypothetical protein QYE76_037539 [Lolium multiflorum]|uniref:Uncharacterized protein n=1 Tax=Lolium multiflorum TaxID=4521 RepID=A0AAD8QFC8_LOLMU|nr:hypothetical protein QYE76_037539 [Lolium multiflorum]